MAINATQVKTEFGAFYLNHGQNLANLIKRIYFSDGGDPTIKQAVITDTVWRRATSVKARIVQAFQKAWTPINDVTFTAFTTLLHKIKGDDEFYPDDLEDSWLQFLMGNGLDRKTYPFVRWYIENHFLPRIEQDILINEKYFGTRVAPTAGTAGSAGNAISGFKKVINDYITAGVNGTIATGAPSATAQTWCEQVEAFAKTIPIKYRKRFPITIRMRDALADRYMVGFNAKYNSQYMQYPNSMVIKDLPNIKVQSELMMSLSATNLAADPAENTTENKIWATIDGNAVEITKRPENMTAVQVENVDRNVKIYTDLSKAFDFEDPTIIWSNDQNL